MTQVRNTASSMLGATPTALPERYVVQAPGRNLVAVSTPNTSAQRSGHRGQSLWR